MSIMGVLRSRTVRIVGGISFAIGLVKPVFQIGREVLDVISEGQTFSELWPTIKWLVLSAYNAPPIWANFILVFFGGGLLFVSRKGDTIRMPSTAPVPGGLIIPRLRTVQEWTAFKLLAFINQKFVSMSTPEQKYITWPE